MKTYTMIEYEQEDFDKVRENMDYNRAIDILQSLTRGWFPYSLPCLSSKVTSSDFENYETCCAIDKAIECMKMVNKNG